MASFFGRLLLHLHLHLYIWLKYFIYGCETLFNVAICECYVPACIYLAVPTLCTSPLHCHSMHETQLQLLAATPEAALFGVKKTCSPVAYFLAAVQDLF